MNKQVKALKGLMTFIAEESLKKTLSLIELSCSQLGFFAYFRKLMER